MRYNVTITGQLDTWTDEDGIRRDAPAFLQDVEAVHSGIVPGSVSLVSVERAPDPEPASTDVTVQDQIAQLQAMLDALRNTASRSA